MNQPKPQLQRVLGLGLLTLYGLGTTIGAGIYALLGKIAGEAGYSAPLAFLVAALLALFSAFSFSDLAARFPKSAGEAVYVKQGLRINWLSTSTGLIVAGTGIISTAALFVGFAAYLDALVPIPKGAAVILIAILLGSLAAWGIRASVTAAAVMTLVEIGGLVLILSIGITHSPTMMPLEKMEFSGWPTVSAVMAGAYLAFYAMIGFEDMVNVAEEVKDVKRTMKRAILLTLAITTLLYTAVAWIALSWVTPELLSESDAPLALAYESITGQQPFIISTIAIFAVINGGLINIVMASRVFYGMSQLEQLPGWLGLIHPRRHTPVNAVLFATAVITLLALSFPLAGLAKTTATLAIAVFSLVNLSLLSIRIREHMSGTVIDPAIPIWIPATGLVICLIFLATEMVNFFS